MDARGLLIPVALLALLLLAPAASAEPTNTSPPTITGGERPQDGVRLTADPGEWDAPPGGADFTYRWLRCTSTGGGCAVIAGATARTYTPGRPDVGRRLRVRVTGDCSVPVVCSPSSKDSGPTGVVAPDPLNAGRPELTGEARQGQVLAASTGFWRSAARLTYSFQWRRCDDAGGACEDIAGATGSGYRLTAADAGRTLRVLVTARNARPRSASALSAASAVVKRLSAPRAPSRRRKRRARLLSPFPTIVIAGMLSSTGADVSEFTVRGPRGAIVRISCRSRGCPFRAKRFRMRGRKLRVRALERPLRAGTVLTLTVRKRGNFIGKHTRIRIRANAAPKRRDLCLRPKKRRPTRCPRR